MNDLQHDGDSCEDDKTSQLRGMSIIAVAPSAYHPSGVAVWLGHVAHALQSFGASFHAALPDSQLHDLTRYMRHYPGLSVVPLRNPTGSQEGRIRAIECALNLVRPDMVLGVDIADTYLAVNRVRRKRRARIHAVMTCHGLVPGLFADARAYREVIDGVVCVNRLSQALMHDVAEIDPKRVKYAPCGAGQPGSSVVRPSMMLLGGDRPLRLAWLGRLESGHKRAHDLAELVKRLAVTGVNFEVYIAGAGTQEQALRMQLDLFERQGRVHWMGALAPERVAPDVLESVDGLIVTSSTESSPLVVWEAMAARVPVVSSRWVGLVREGRLRHEINCLLFPVGDMGRAAECILRLRDPDLRTRLISGATALHGQFYSAVASARAWARALGTIAGAAARPGLRGDPGQIQISGRLDKWLTPRFAEAVRVVLGRRHLHASPGLEWPWQNHRGLSDDELMKRAAALDVSSLGKP